MEVVDIVKEQIEASHRKVVGLSKGVDFDNWYTIPDGLGTNVAWQLGHLIISKPFQLVIAPIERTKEIYDVIPFGEYLKRYGIGTLPTDKKEGSPSPKELLDHFDKIHHYSLRRLDDFDSTTLHFPTVVPHPIAKTRYECLMWSFQHEIWHCGQLSMLRRVFGKPLTF
ncbi:MAG: DinB family protein [Cyclobacteriaceae bacterium]|nr:DinB family protein [Cyclobacteriaceae bacterium]